MRQRVKCLTPRRERASSPPRQDGTGVTKPKAAATEAADPAPDLSLRKRENTRARLIRAGRKLFFTRDYSSISVDQIAKEAGFTRAAFYLHFASKDELVAVIMLNEAHRSEPLFQWFESHPRDLESMAAFVRAFVASGSEFWAARLFHVAALQSPVALDAYKQNRQRLMAVMGKGFPAFLPPRDDSADERERAVRATLVLVALEQLSIREYALIDHAFGEAMVARIAQDMLELDRAYPG